MDKLKAPVASPIMRKLVEQFQCPGCVRGCDTECGSFEFGRWATGGACVGHVAGTVMGGVGTFFLGMPKGFNRCGRFPKYILEAPPGEQSWPIILFEEGRFPSGAFNGTTFIPVWAMEMDGFLFVRTMEPRINRTMTLVIEGGTLDMVPKAVDVGKFYEEID